MESLLHWENQDKLYNHSDLDVKLYPISLKMFNFTETEILLKINFNRNY
jgi:hypothetical protein